MVKDLTQVPGSLAFAICKFQDDIDKISDLEDKKKFICETVFSYPETKESSQKARDKWSSFVARQTTLVGVDNVLGLLIKGGKNFDEDKKNNSNRR